MPKQKISILKKIISSKYLFLFLIFFLLLALIYLAKEINYRMFLAKELDYLKKQVEDTESENQILLDGLEKAKSEYFKEKAARLNLGLQKPGERTVVIVPLEAESSCDDSPSLSPRNSFNNIKAWRDYFFKKHNH
ncbi:hypothetical protein B6D52_01990 [Candidatus Parcubacteria bacterium 4484_255]|nr:MAG: hypothetical protein B6D52_01990 [Candidatus Parcubacteria bacterium 4484_255]